MPDVPLGQPSRFIRLTLARTVLCLALSTDRSDASDLSIQIRLGSSFAFAAMGCGGSSTIAADPGPVHSGNECPADGQTAPADDGCNTCSCTSGVWACTDIACSVCKPGDGKSDGCNTCACSTNGQWECTLLLCPPTPHDNLRGGSPAPARRPNIAPMKRRSIAAAGTSGAPVSPSRRFARKSTRRFGLQWQNYGNACLATADGVSVASTGSCETPAICPDGETKHDSCNFCVCQKGTWACTDYCPPPPPSTPCGGWYGNTCQSNEYRAYEPGQLCGAADASAFCKVKPEVCPSNDLPVCGCNGKTYGNACDAGTDGTGVNTEGSCEVPLLSASRAKPNQVRTDAIRAHARSRASGSARPSHAPRPLRAWCAAVNSDISAKTTSIAHTRTKLTRAEMATPQPDANQGRPRATTSLRRCAAATARSTPTNAPRPQRAPVCTAKGTPAQVIRGGAARTVQP